MPNIKSAKKRVEVIQKKTLRNASLKSSLKTAIRRFEESLTAKGEDSGDKLQRAVISIDKAVTKGIMHKNAAARKKSRLTLRYNKATSEANS